MKKILLIITIIFFSFIGFNKTYAATSDNLFGNAWSFNVGWISFNSCANPLDSSTCGSIDYGVKKTGSTISGYAWNDNVGWISFNPADWGSCPPAYGSSSCSNSSYSSYTNTLGVGGWGRVLSAKNNSSSDWDGWIAIGGNGSGSVNGWGVVVRNTNVTSNLGTGFTGTGADIKSMDGFMWGSEVMGWIDVGPHPARGIDVMKYGGVYYLASYTGGYITLTSSVNSTATTSILSGDTIDISWVVNGFTPTSCTGSGTGTYSDWAKTTTVSTDNGKFTDIHVPNDTTTNFILKCTDGTAQAVGSVSIEAKTLTATLVNYTNACVTTGTKPILTWTTNDPSPSCTVTATPNSGSSYTFNTSGTSPSTVQDTNFKDKNTTYSMTCTNGTGSYKASATSATNTAYATMCTPSYTVKASTSCSGADGAVVSKVAGSSPTKYEGTATLSLTPTNGFNSNASVSANNSTGTETISPSSGFSYNSGYNTVTAKLSLSQTEYSTLYSSMTNNILRTMTITTKGSAQNTNNKTWKINFCDKSSTSNGGTLTLTPSKTAVTSGDTVDFTWSLSGFTPTNCTGSGAGNSDWDKKTTTTSASGTFTGINVPVNTATKYTLTCTDGKSTATQDALVAADALTADVSYGGSCVASGGTKPYINWSTNDSSPSCTITGQPTDGSVSHSFTASGSGSTQDSNYGYKDTKYYLSCTNGSGAYKVTAVSTPPPTVPLCVPDYTITGSLSCQGGIGDVFSSIGGGKYKADVDLTLGALNGFTSNADVTGTSSLGTFTLTPSSNPRFTRTGGVYNTVNAALTITNAEYSALSVLKKIALTITGTAQNTTSKTVNVNFCKTQGGVLTLSPSSTSVISGDTVDFSWSLSGFTPTSCTRSGSPNSDWSGTTSNPGTSGGYTGVHVPNDVTTSFAMSCTDGTDTASATVDVAAKPLSVGISYGGSCINTGSKPSISWFTNDTTPTCSITGTDSDGSSHTLSNVSSNPKSDTGFTNKTTTYSIACTNGSGSYQASASKNMVGTVGMCGGPNGGGTSGSNTIKPHYKPF